MSGLRVVFEYDGVKVKYDDSNGSHVIFYGEWNEHEIRFDRLESAMWVACNWEEAMRD